MGLNKLPDYDYQHFELGSRIVIQPQTPNIIIFNSPRLKDLYKKHKNNRSYEIKDPDLSFLDRMSGARSVNNANTRDRSNLAIGSPRQSSNISKNNLVLHPLTPSNRVKYTPYVPFSQNSQRRISNFNNSANSNYGLSPGIRILGGR